MDQLESYRTAAGKIGKFLSSYPTFDALSDYEFYAHGLLNTPVVANNHIDEFISRGVDNLWAYYCCAQYKQVSIASSSFLLNATGSLAFSYISLISKAFYIGDIISGIRNMRVKC